MKRKIQLIYKKKSVYYQELIEKLDSNKVNFVLINAIVADDNPGDLDIIINSVDYNRCKKYLTDLGFIFYTTYDTNQYLWNKYIRDVGFIQAHIYCGLWFNGKNFYNGKIDFYQCQYDYNFNFYVFLIESYFKNKLRQKQYDEYKLYINQDEFVCYVKKISKDATVVVKQVLDAYEKKETFRKPFKYISLTLIILKLFRILHNQDREVLFLGVDGAGKSTLVDSIKNIYAKGGIYPVVKYMGLKSSIFARKHDENKENHVIETKINSFCIMSISVLYSILRFVKVLFYWAEFNIRYFFSIRLLKNSSATVYLIDRCYVDLLMYHPISLVRFLFTKFSFTPYKVVILTGNMEELYNRKKEMNLNQYKEIYTFYKDIESLFSKKYGQNLLLVNTTENSMEDCIWKISNFIYE